MSSGIRKVISLIVVLGVLFVAYQYMIKPANKAIEEQKVAVMEKEKRLLKLEEARAAVKDLNAQIQKLQDAIDYFNNRLPSKDDVYKVLHEVTQIAQQQGLKTELVETLKAVDCNGYVELPLKMKLEGDFVSYYDFLLKLENMDRITRIREMDLKSQPKSDGESLDNNFTVSVFMKTKA